SNKNFYKHAQILKSSLDRDNIEILSKPIKATYNGPFTLPNLRRNEAMYLVPWEN
ncbi:heme-binding protein, partial [bacterium]|nr:heme-binding protein [bacterium]